MKKPEKTTPTPSLDENRNAMPEPLDKTTSAISAVISAFIVGLGIKFLGINPSKYLTQANNQNPREHQQ